MQAEDISEFNATYKNPLHRALSPAQVEFEQAAKGRMFTVAFGTTTVEGQPTQYGGVEMHRVGILEFPVDRLWELSPLDSQLSTQAAGFTPALYQSFVVRSSADVALLNTRWKLTDLKTAAHEAVLRYTCQRIEDGSP